MKTLAAVYWMIDGVSWLCHVVADLTCSSFILLTSCILALPTYRLLGWSSWRWCMVFQQNHDSTLTDALCGRWLTMVFGHCLGSCRTNALSVAEKTRVFSLGQTLESPASPRYSLPGKCPQMKFFDAWLGGSCQLTTSRWCAIQQWDNYINMNPTRGIHFFWIIQKFYSLFMFVHWGNLLDSPFLIFTTIHGMGSEEKTNTSAQSHGLQCIEDQPGGAAKTTRFCCCCCWVKGRFFQNLSWEEFRYPVRRYFYPQMCFWEL